MPRDPDNVPVRTVNLAHADVIGSVVSLTCMTDRIGYAEDGTFKRDLVIAARLRFDLEIAKIIRDQLDTQIALLSRPPGHPN
jgi:hypothetical protein